MNNQNNATESEFLKGIAILASIVGIICPILAFFGISQFTDFFSTYPRETRIQPETQVNYNDTPSPPDTPTPVGIKNPTGIVSAETPILADGLQLILLSTLDIRKDSIGINGVIKNVSDKQKILRYNLASIKLKDDLGNEYLPEGHDKAHNQAALQESRQKQLDRGQYFNLRSDGDYSFFQGSMTGGLFVQPFEGPISPNAHYLIVIVENFGPFPPLQIAIDL